MTTASVSPAPVPDPLLLAALRQRISEQQLGVRTIHVYRPGKDTVVFQNYAEVPENLYSVSKTVTALAVGCAREENLLDIEDRVVDHLPAPQDGFGEGWEQVRIRHLLTMTSGSPVVCFDEKEREAEHLTDLILSTDLVSTPGDRFVYSNGSTFMLSRILTERTGSTVRDYLLPTVFLPLGITNPQWFTDREGFSWGATGLHLTGSDAAKIGKLLFHDGQWEGKQLVPAAWIEQMHADDTWVQTGNDEDPEGRYYGFGVWKNSIEGSWRADGAFGQFLVMLPERNAMVAITSHIEGRGNSDILRAVWDELLPLL